ncbi:MAG: cation:proton antiporter [Candidatus Blackburnbacteria bacterium]|nr:cation:proton antiporter [Candidatus Blackburnbacteria bacterium]
MGNTNLLFLQLAGVLGMGSFFGYLVHRFKLPLIVAYLLVGVAFSVSGLLGIARSEMLLTFSEIGIAIVLFFIGMEMDVREIKSLGKPIVFTAIVQIVLSTFVGWGIGQFLGFSSLESFYLGVALAFSSTIVVVKLLLEKRDMFSLYGKLSIGILLLEDLIAIIILMGMTVGSSFLNLGLQSTLPVATLLSKGMLLGGLTFVLSKYILRRVFNSVSSSTELLFLTALSWCFIFVAVSLFLGFSVVIGAFLAGIALANSPFYYEIQGKVRPLRDFFVMLFFVYLGSQVAFGEVGRALPLVVAFVLYALIVKPIVFLSALGMFGFRKHTMFQTAINLSQISEFSLIVMVLGFQAGFVSQTALTAVALTVVLSVMFSSILISFSRALYKKLNRLASFFEQSKYVHKIEIQKKENDLQDHVIVIGAHRMGGEIVKYLSREKIPFLVLDFNPRVIANLVNEKVNAIYGDVGDPEILDFLNLENARFVISTAPSLEDNLVLVGEIRRRKHNNCLVIARGASAREAKLLYKNGANFVVLPEMIGGEYLVQLLANHWGDREYFKSRAEVELNRIFRNRFVLV